MVTATAVAVPMMTVDEARRTVEQIKSGLENVRVLALDLQDREGWRALGYESWRACVSAEFGKSEAYLYRLADAARIDQIVSPTGENSPIPERHARELKPLINEPEAVRTIHAKVQDAKGGKATAEDYHDAVDEHFGRPVKPRTPKPSTRRTSDPDISQDVPDDVVLGTNEVPNDGTERTADEFGDVVNNEPQIGPNRTSWCQDCGERYSGEACACKSAAQAEDGSAVEPTGVGTAVAGDDRRSAGTAHSAHQGASRNGTANRQPAYSRSAPSGPPPLTIQGDAGDAMRAVADRFALDRVAEGIGEAYSDAERGSLTAQLLDSLPDSEKARIAHRANVAVKSQPATAPTLVQVAEMGEALTAGEQLGVTSRWVKAWPVTDLERLATFLPHLIERKRRESGGAPLAAAV